MTDQALPALTIEDLSDLARYAELHPPREPFQVNHTMQVYQHPHVRWQLALERTSDIGYGLWREDTLGEHNIFGAELDARAFAKNLWGAIGDHFSLREAEQLLELLQKDVTERRERIDAARKQLASMNG